MMTDSSNGHDSKLDSVVTGSITISALIAGFVLIFIGFVLTDSSKPSVLQLLTLFVGSLLFEFFYRAMVKSWNLLAVRGFAKIGDQILDGSLKSGREHAAFRVIWAFQPKLFQGSWLLLVLMALYGATKSWWNVLAIVVGFLFGLGFYSVHAERSWKKTWRRCRAWDKVVYLGDPIPHEKMPFHQWLFTLISSFKHRT